MIVVNAATADPRGSGAAARSRFVLEEADVGRALNRIAHEILERTKGGHDTVLMGIPTRGVSLARRLGQQIERFEGHAIAIGSLDITMHRDDLRLRPARALERTDMPQGGIDGKRVVLVDDVLYSGRTVRAALDALADLGRPRTVQLAILVDRGHRELPIRADYVGKNLPTSESETVRVLCREVDGRDAVLIGDVDTTGDARRDHGGSPPGGSGDGTDAAGGGGGTDPAGGGGGTDSGAGDGTEGQR